MRDCYSLKEPATIESDHKKPLIPKICGYSWNSYILGTENKNHINGGRGGFFLCLFVW